MQVARFNQILLPIIVGALLQVGCTTTVLTEPQTVTGTFTGMTPEGNPIVVTLEQSELAFSGQGTLSGQPIVLAGPLTWSALGTLTGSGGSFSVIRLRLSPDSDMLSIERTGKVELVLHRGGSPVPPSAGAFAGRYRAVREGTALAEATIAQHGSLLSGVAILLGDPVGINGRVTAPNKAKGVITFLDESQVTFKAELSEGGDSVSLRGLGAPINLQRQ